MLPFTKPDIQESINCLTYGWLDMDVVVVADRLTDSGQAELYFYHQNGDGRKLLHITKANLLSTSTVNQISKRMVSHEENVPWQDMLTFIATTTIEYQRRGEPPEVIEAVDEMDKPGYYVEPLIMKGVPNIIYGDKGVNKTTVCLACLGLIHLGVTDGTFGLSALEQEKVGLLDWESSKDLTKYTLSRLVTGQTIPPFPLDYLRCKMPLADDIARISKFISDRQIKVVLIDSLGQAAGSDKFDSAGKGTALKFFECLRQLNVTSLIIAQNAKNAESNSKTIYGSTYFTYYARNIFELKKSKDSASQNEMSVALFHQESNYSKKWDPIGFNISYSDHAIMITHEEVTLSKFLEKVSQTKTLLDFLKTGPQSRAAMAKVLNTSLQQIGVLLSRLKKRNMVIELGNGIWGLSTEDEIPDDDVSDS